MGHTFTNKEIFTNMVLSMHPQQFKACSDGNIYLFLMNKPFFLRDRR